MTEPKTESNTCDYNLDGENLTALWTEFQKKGEASCPVTGAKIELENRSNGETSEPEVQVNCQTCGRSATFKPGQHESFGWAE